MYVLAEATLRSTPKTSPMAPELVMTDDNPTAPMEVPNTSSTTGSLLPAQVLGCDLREPRHVQHPRLDPPLLPHRVCGESKLAAVSKRGGEIWKERLLQ